MNISVKNRKELCDKLGHFIDYAVLEPKLIYDICNKEIDEHYFDSIR